MSRIVCRYVLLVCLFSLTRFAHAGLSIYTEDLPPLNYVKDGQLSGIAVALVNEIQHRIDDKTPIQVLPWARAYENAQKETHTALFSMTRTEERERLFKWVGPLTSRTWVFVTKKGSAVNIKSLEDAKKLKAIGVYNNDAKEQYLKKEGFTNLESVVEDSANAKKLIIGRIDAWLTGEQSLPGHVERAGEKMDEFEVAFVAQRKVMYIAFSLRTDDATVKKWQTALDGMIRDGTFAAIHKAYKATPPSLQ